MLVAADLPVCVRLALPGLYPSSLPRSQVPSLPSLPTMRPAPVRVCAFLSLLFSSLLLVSAQSTSTPANSTITSSSSESSQTPTSTPTPTPSANLTTFLVTSSYTTTSASLSGSQEIPFTTVVPIVYNVTSTLPTPTAAANASASATPSPTPIVLATEISPAFGVLGAILILTGLPSAFWGHKNRWCAVSSPPHI